MVTLVIRVKVAIHVAFASSGFWGGLHILLGNLGFAFAAFTGSFLLRNFILFGHLVGESFFDVISFYVMIAHIRMVRAMRSVRVDGSVGVFGRTPGASR